MKHVLLLAFSFIFFVDNSDAQAENNAVNDAYVITRMAEKFHVQPRPVDDVFSNDVYTQFLKQLDGERILFTKEDINKLQSYRLQIDDQIKQKKPAFLQLITSLYQLRVTQADTLINNICKNPFNFSLAEKLSVAEDTSYPADFAAMRLKLYKRLKLSVLTSLTDATEDLPVLTPAAQKKRFDSLEIVLRKKTQTSFKRFIKTMLQSPGGLQQAIAILYCQTIASCYDPHTEYFPLTEKENFESQLGNNAFEFGFGLDASADGGVAISNLKPGSPAFKSGLLNQGDKLLSLQWEGKDVIDVSDADEDEVAGILSASNHDKIIFTIKKTDGSVRKLTLQKEKAGTADEENKVKSFLLKGNKTIGYISLPAFYSDWQDAETDINGCANDVTKEILKLSGDKIDGLILDLRYNGGGSMQEAVSLAGIFIDAGPVGLVKGRDPKVYTLKDANRGAIYTGPLLVLVNSYSASASEIVAGALQDYNRALIVGTPTYGKATSQVVLPMDTTINMETGKMPANVSSYIKVTMNKLYRVTGASIQAKGIQPDVMVPDIYQADEEHEVDEPFAIPPSSIDANKFYKPYAPIDLASLKSLAEKDINADNYFQHVEQFTKTYKSLNQDKDVSLKWDDAEAEKKKYALLTGESKETKDMVAPGFSVEMNTYEQQRVQVNGDLKESSEQFEKFLSKDHCLKIAYDLLSSMTK